MSSRKTKEDSGSTQARDAALERLRSGEPSPTGALAWGHSPPRRTPEAVARSLVGGLPLVGVEKVSRVAEALKALVEVEKSEQRRRAIENGHDG